MKLQFLKDDTSDNGIVRLFEFSIKDAFAFQLELMSLAEEECNEVAVHKLPFIKAIDDTRLTLWGNHWDQSMVLSKAPASFDCRLTSATWQRIAELIEPFKSGDVCCYQWLTGVAGEFPLLFSSDGNW